MGKKVTELELHGVVYKKPEHIKFIQDMQRHGIGVELYHGRFYWYGPMARTDERNGPSLQEVLGATRVKCQRDNLAMDWCVYPVVGDEDLKGAREVYTDDEED